MAVPSSNPEFGAYFHIPFCDTKCTYCDFFSLTKTDQADSFYAAIHREIGLRFDQLTGIPSGEITSVFFGGGTPSLADPILLGDLISELGRFRPISPSAEITLEANPGTLNPSKLKTLRQVGFNRISMGVQSFHDPDLKALSRIHSAETARNAVFDAAEAGFTNISIDLIFGLQGQTQAAWLQNLQVATNLPITHLSAYNLIVEEKTPLFHQVKSGLIQLPGPDDCADFYEDTIRHLEENGFDHYEVSNFAKPGFQSVHNGTYWKYQPWLAFGPSAFGLIGSYRYKNSRNLTRYIDCVNRHILPVDETENLTPEMALNERILLGVRTRSGLSLEPDWALISQEQQHLLREKLEGLHKTGYIHWLEPNLAATATGLRFGDAIATQLLIDH